MRILFAQNMFHVPAHGGANKSNRIFAEQLAAYGHECHLVAPLTGALGGSDPDALAGYLTRAGARWQRRDDTAVVYELAGVRAHAVISPTRLAKRVRAVAAQVDPDWIVVPSDDPARMVLAAALAAAPDRVLYVAYTIQQLPCGPAAFAPSPVGTELVRRAAGVVAISRAAQSYLHRWARIDSELLYPPVYDAVSPDHPHAPGTGSVTMINPCGYKGLPVLLGLAEAFPDIPFLAVPTWGTTADDRAALARLPNLEVVEATDDIGVVLRRTKVLLMPSLWDETFGFTCVDAMLRGVPVLASDVAGLVEAKLGVPYLLPVRRIAHYDASADPSRPVPEIPAQDLAPWRDALRRLLTDPTHFDDIAARSRTAATDFVDSLDSRGLERYLTARLPHDPSRPDPPRVPA